METKTAKTAKNVELNANAKESTIKTLLDEIKDINVTVYKSNVNTKRELYKYAEGLTLKEKKVLRRKLRNTKTVLCTTLIEQLQNNNTIEAEKTKIALLAFYKTNFSMQDFSIESFSSVSEQTKPQLKNIYSICLRILKDEKIK